jgi:hypothetical protein
MPPEMPRRSHAVLDVIELLADSGPWPAGTIGTVVEADSERALVEISDDRGHALDFIAVPHDALTRPQITPPSASPPDHA